MSGMQINLLLELSLMFNCTGTSRSSITFAIPFEGIATQTMKDELSNTLSSSRDRVTFTPKNEKLREKGYDSNHR